MKGAIRKYRTPRQKRKHSLDPTKTRVCANCRKEKPYTEFYARAENRSLPISECIECMKERNRKRKLTDPHSTTVLTEEWVLRELASRGIPALPGKALGRYYCDVLAWGCVPIEVKSAVFRKGIYQFKFSTLQQKGHLRGDIIVLICISPGEPSFHLFDARDTLFYKNGVLRNSLTYNESPKGPPSATYGRPLTKENMLAAKDDWDLVETVRLRNAAAVKEQADRDRLSEVYLREIEPD